MADGDRIVYRRDDGMWVDKRVDAEKAASAHETQAEAIRAAHDRLENSGGGELIVKGRDGQIRSKDTIGKHDPNPPHDREH